MNTSSTPELKPEQIQELLQSERFRRLASELRCLVCQNQTLADSNAELAGDLRAEVLRQMATGKDDAAIKAHLVDRFGEFVLYRPTLSPHNLGLWAGPAVLAAVAGLALWRMTRQRKHQALKGQAPAAAAAAEWEQINALLGPAPSAPSAPGAPAAPSAPSASASSAPERLTPPPDRG
jgi:cytochrome c-type biogenesis protein CcmH